MLGQRRGRWTSIVPILACCIVFVGFGPVLVHTFDIVFAKSATARCPPDSVFLHGQVDNILTQNWCCVEPTHCSVGEIALARFLLNLKVSDKFEGGSHDSDIENLNGGIPACIMLLCVFIYLNNLPVFIYLLNTFPFCSVLFCIHHSKGDKDDFFNV